jgi:hypothetical protein
MCSRLAEWCVRTGSLAKHGGLACGVNRAAHSAMSFAQVVDCSTTEVAEPEPRVVCWCLALLVSAAGAWPSTMYLMNLEGGPKGAAAAATASSPVIDTARQLLTSSTVVKVCVDARALRGRVASLLGGAEVAALQDVRALITSAHASGAAADLLPDVAALVPLQERLLNVGCAAADLQSLSGLGADAWSGHPLSSICEAATAKLLMQVYQARQALSANEATLDLLLNRLSEFACA